MPDAIEITHEKEPDGRMVIEFKKVTLQDGSKYEIERKEYGDVECLRNLESAKKQLINWQSTDPQKYIDQKISEAQTEVDKWQPRYDAMNLTDAEWLAISEGREFND